MKKIISVVLAVLTMLTACVPAFADVAAPILVKTDAVITNPLGAQVYSDESSIVGDWKITATMDRVPYDTKISVTGEFMFNGELYFNFNTEDKKHRGIIKGKDAASLEESVPASNGYKPDAPMKVFVFKETHFYKGNSHAFDTVGEKIKAGTVLNIEYLIGDKYSMQWGYARHNGNEGWINLYSNLDESPVAFYLEEKSNYNGYLVVAADGVKLLDSPVNPEKNADVNYVSGVIPVGTKLEYEFYKNVLGGMLVYTEFNGVKGWLCYYLNDTSENKIAIGKDSLILVNQDNVPVYSAIMDKSSKVMKKLNKNELLHSTLFLRDNVPFDENWAEKSWCGVQFGEKIGWIEIESAKTSLFQGSPEGFLADSGNIKVYKDSSKSSGVLTTIPSGDYAVRIWLDRNNMGLVDYNGKVGWVDYEDFTGFDRIEFTIDEYCSGKLTSDYIRFVITGEKPPVAKTTKAPATTAQPETTAAEQETEDIVTTTVVTTQAEITTEETLTEETTVANDSMTPGQITVMCIAGAMILAVTAAVSIVFIKKKKAE